MFFFAVSQFWQAHHVIAVPGGVFCPHHMILRETYDTVVKAYGGQLRST
jgi:hypothetical protein